MWPLALIVMVLAVSPGCVCFVPVAEQAPDAGRLRGGGDDISTLTGSADTPAVALHEGTLHLFAHDPVTGELKWCGDAVNGCTWQTLDGAGGSEGRTTANVAAECITAVSWGSALHVFYRQDDANDAHTLRHGLYSGGSWLFETLDGLGGTHGRTLHRVGGCPSAAPYSVWLFITFYDYDDRALRLGWFGGVDWDFLTLDGKGGSSGRISADVGYWSSMVSDGTSIRTYYSDATNQDLREGWWGGAADWTLATRDGQAGQGTTDAIAGRIATAFHESQVHVFYADTTQGQLRHAWSTPTWSSEVLDGDSTLGGRVTHAVGSRGIAATSASSGLHVFYDDATGGDLRHASFTSTWSWETADGDSSLGGRIVGDVGRNPASAATTSGVWVFSEGPTQTIRQQAW